MLMKELTSTQSSRMFLSQRKINKEKREREKKTVLKQVFCAWYVNEKKKRNEAKKELNVKYVVLSC